jgi:methylated-DNA-[protein]-cysteine S-methyltransferase
MTLLAAASRQRQHCLLDTPLGPIGLAWSEQGLARLQLPEAERATTERRLAATAHSRPAPPLAAIADAIGLLQRYCAGERVDFAALALDLADAPPFHRQVYEAARVVGWGETATYGEIARRVGEPGAARAVGQALGRNPIAIIVPCHRILASGGRIGGFSAHGGARAKARLLALEGVHAGGTPPLPGLLAD